MWLDDDLAAISPKGEDEYDELTIDAAAGARARAFVALFRRPLNSSYNTDDSAWRTELAAELAAELADDLKNAANDALAMFTNFAESMSQATELQGKSLGILDTDHPLRVALHKFIQHPLVESFLLLLIMFNLIALAPPPLALRSILRSSAPTLIGRRVPRQGVGNRVLTRRCTPSTSSVRALSQPRRWSAS